MSKTPQIRTLEALRAEAAGHFDRVAERSQLFGLTPEDGLKQAQLGKLLLDSGLALAADEVLDLGDWFEAQACTETDKRLAVGTLPYITGDALRVLKMEFTHPDIGVLPLDEVRALLDSEEPRPYQGVNLTKDTVFVQYRRLAL